MKKGFASVVLALAFLQISLLALKTENAVQNENSFALLRTLEMENAFFKRAEVENNLDFLIGQTMKSEIGKKNIDSRKIKERIIQNILEYIINSGQNNGNNSVNFFIEKNGQQAQPNFEDLEKATQVLIAGTGQLATAQFFFTGGPEKNIFLKAKITFEKFSNEFMFPKGYTISETVVVN